MHGSVVNVMVSYVHCVRYEGFFGARAHHNLCVTDAMKLDLGRRWGIR